MPHVGEILDEIRQLGYVPPFLAVSFELWMAAWAELWVMRDGEVFSAPIDRPNFLVAGIPIVPRKDPKP